MKKIYKSPEIETIVLSADLMQGGQTLNSSGDEQSGFAPKRRADKPF